MGKHLPRQVRSALRAWLPQVGDVLVFVVVHGREVRGFVTNDLGLSDAVMVRLYG